MQYQNYIDLGFKRIELSCVVEFKQTGYHGYALEFKINEKMMIGTASGELDNPKLYIKRKNSDSWHIFQITPQSVIDLVQKEPIDYSNLA